jgi:hypothetical protein
VTTRAAARSAAFAAIALGLLAVLLAAGWAAATGHATILLAAAGAAGICTLALTQRGAFVGICLLTAMDGLPFIAASRHVTSKITVEDVAVMVLVLAAAAWIVSASGEHRPSTTGRILSYAGAALTAWWGFTVLRTWAGQELPLTRAASFGRDFGYFGALLMVLPRVRLSRRDVGALLGVLTVGTCLFAIGQIMIGTGLGQPGSLISYRYTLVESGVTRVYANMTDLVTAGLAVSISACLLARNPKIRLVAVPIAILLTVSTVLQLTRARWIAIVVALLVISLWFIFNDNARVSAVLRRRLGVMIAALVLVGMTVALTAPGILSGGTVIHRLSSVFTEFQSGGGTVAVRESVTKTLTAYLGDKWPAGLGFVAPTTHYFEGLPEGSIRDSDVGVLNAVMTMGAIGAAFIYLPVLAMLFACLRRTPRNRDAPYGWLRLGGAIWILATLISSITLVTLFSASGLAMTAVFLTVLAHPSLSEPQRAVSTSTRTRSAPHKSLSIPRPRGSLLPGVPLRLGAYSQPANGGDVDP